VPSRPVIEYRRKHWFALSPSELWTAIEQVDQFARWWPWLEDFRFFGVPLEAGAVLQGVVAPPLPYRMRVRVELTRCERPARIDARVTGDLVGDARLAISESDGGSSVETAWEIEMMQRAMRLASRVAHPLLQWGHDRVVDVTVAGFRRQVESQKS
jgi:hypothetical protein